MKIILSPAKTLDFESPVPTNLISQPTFLEKADEINSVLRNKSPKKLMELMSISDKLAQLNWERNQQWENTSLNRQAIFAFKGDVYLGLDAYSIDIEKMEYLKNTIRILSGQYGILKPLDVIKPYRLEMSTDLKIGQKKNLYHYWQNSVTEKINEELDKEEVLINLASNEYFKVIQTNKISSTIITPIFKDFKNGKYKVISFFAKKARGLMARFAIDYQINNPMGLKTFNSEGYAYDENLSTNLEWVFKR